MTFVAKEWKDRLVEYAGRRKLKNVATGEEVVYDVSRQEGNISQNGDAFSAENMNDLEHRVEEEFNAINSNLGGLSFYEDATGKYVVGADSVPKKLGEPKIYYDYKAMINSPIGESKTWKSTINGYIIASTTWLSNAHVYVNGARLNTGQIGMAKSTIKVGDTVIMTADACPGKVSMACIVVVGY